MITKAKQPSEPKETATSVGEIIAKKKTKTHKLALNCPKCNRFYKIPESLAKHVSKCDGKLGGGMPKGHTTEKTRELKLIKAEMMNRIAGKANELIAAQMRMAMGTHRLFMRELVDMGQLKRGNAPKGNERKTWKVSRVLDDAEFMIYLSLEHDEHGNAKDPDTGIEYFYQVSGEGNYAALANLLDRAFGKPKENIEVGEDPDAPIGKHGTGSTTALREAFVDLVKSQIKTNGKGVKSGKNQGL